MNKDKKINASTHSSRRLLAAIVTVLTLFTFASCDKGNAVSPPENDTSTSSNSNVETEEVGVELKPDGTIDSDVDSITGITIRSAAELAKIGRNAKYPMDGDYVLVADIDCSKENAFTPIGNASSDCGIVEGKNVFTGTFDGRGHTILGLSISVTSTERVHVGLFGTVGSNNADDPAVIKNLILKDVTVTGTANGPATYAALAGQVNGYAILDNISLLSGKVEVENANGDILGIGSLVGQCRTQEWTGCSNEGIHITNIFSNLTVIGDNNGWSNYTSGLIGRVRASDLGTLSNILQIGTVTHEGGKGNAISSGDSKAKTSEHVYYLAGCGTDHGSFGHAKTYDMLVNGEIILDEESWRLENGSYPLLKNTYDSPLFSVLDFVSIQLADGESADKVKSDFTLVDTVMGKSIKWKSSDESVIKIDGGSAKVTRPKLGFADVTLTARADGINKTYTLRVSSGVKGEIVRVDDTTLEAKNYPAGVSFKWVVKNPSSGKVVKTAASSDGKFTLDNSMKNAMVTLCVEGYDDVSFYNSNLPTISITSDTAYYDVNKGGYVAATLDVYSTDAYPKTAYNGDIEIKLRGNSTAYQAKRPFHIKLAKRTDLFGMGENKHWVLLANAFDRTNLRNKLSYDFGASLGLLSCESILVNVVYNGEFYGLYQLSENVRVDEGRVDIFDWEDAAKDVAKSIAVKEGLSKAEESKLKDKMEQNLAWVTSGKFDKYNIADYYDLESLKAKLNGGYLIEDDYYYDEVSKFTTENEMKLMIKSPEFASTNKEMMNAIQTYIQSMEDALYAPNRLNSEGKHYSEYMDVDSFIDFWMVNQVFKNVELLYKSCYMYKDVDDVLRFGPVWDMDWTSGNHVNLGGNSGKYNTWWHSESQDREYWYRALYNDPHFVLMLYDRWGEIQEQIDAIFTQLDTLNEEIRDSAMIDNQRWWYDWSYDNEIASFRKWMEDRRAWMEKQFATPETLLESFGYYQDSKKIGITGVYEGTDYLDLYITLKDESIQSGDLLINGKLVREEALTDGCKIRIEMSELREAGKYNAIEILAKTENGSYITAVKRGGQRGSTMVNADCYYYLSK